MTFMRENKLSETSKLNKVAKQIYNTEYNELKEVQQKTVKNLIRIVDMWWGS